MSGPQPPGPDPQPAPRRVQIEPLDLTGEPIDPQSPRDPLLHQSRVKNWRLRRENWRGIVALVIFAPLLYLVIATVYGVMFGDSPDTTPIEDATFLYDRLLAPLITLASGAGAFYFAVEHHKKNGD